MITVMILKQKKTALKPIQLNSLEAFIKATTDHIQIPTTKQNRDYSNDTKQ